MKIKELFEGGELEKEIAKRIKANLPDQSKIKKNTSEPSTSKDDGKSLFYKKGYQAGLTGKEAPGDSEAMGPSKEYQAGYKAGIAARESLGESDAGTTTSGNIGTVDAPHISPGASRGKKSYIGDPRTGVSGTKAPKQPKVKQPKKKDGTAVNALDMGTSIFGGGALKR